MSEAFPYSVVQGAGESGRIAVASRPLSPGEIVLAERAIVCVAALGRDVCDDCLEPVRQVFSQCRTAVSHSNSAGSVYLLVLKNRGIHVLPTESDGGTMKRRGAACH